MPQTTPTVKAVVTEVAQAWKTLHQIAAEAQITDDKIMARKSGFKTLSEPWKLNRLDRMRYLIDHLVWENSIQQVYFGDDWMISKSDANQILVALWPTPESVNQCMELSEEAKLKKLSKDGIEDELFSKMYEDEYIAAFPNSSLEYEILTVSEMKKAIHYSYLQKKSRDKNLTDEESRELTQYFMLNLKGNKKS